MYSYLPYFILLPTARNSTKQSGLTVNASQEDLAQDNNEESRYHVETVMSAPAVEYASAEGGAMTEQQIALTRTHKLTYMKISQLLDKTGELLATHRDEPDDIIDIDINGASARGGMGNVEVDNTESHKED